MTKVIKREHAERARAHESVLAVPEVMRTAPGIAIQGRKIRSLVFSTDLAVICHCDADAVLAVYPFTCQPAITQALVAASQRPVFNGVGGSITQGERCVEAALHSEMSGVAAVVSSAARTGATNITRQRKSARSARIFFIVTTKLSEIKS